MIDIKELRAKAEIGLPDGTVKLMIKPATILALLDEIERTKREFDEVNSTYIRLETEAVINIEALKAADEIKFHWHCQVLKREHTDVIWHSKMIKLMENYSALRNPK